MSEGRAGVGVGRQLGAERVQPSLHLFADRPDVRMRAQRLGEADSAGRLVDGAVRLDPRIILARASTAQQSGRTVVARSRQLEHPLFAGRHAPLYSKTRVSS